MTHIEQLEYERLLNQLDYYTKEKRTKTELGSAIGRAFLSEVSGVVKNHAELDERWEQQAIRTDAELDNLLRDVEPAIGPNREKPFTQESKELYRQLVKVTHPDKVANRTDAYVAATQAYEVNDVVALLLLAKQHGVAFTATRDLLDYMRNHAMSLKDEIAFLEATLAWNWYYATDATEKEDLLLRYISNRLS